MSMVGIIPARMGSSRFPGKPLAKIHGKSMLEHVYRRSTMCTLLARVVVATPDAEIAKAVTAFGGTPVMTSPAHQRAVDRVAEAAQSIGGDIVVVIQGDEPLLHPEMIEAAIQPVRDEPAVFCSNVIEPIDTVEEFYHPNTIKVTMDALGNALYFSRQPIPHMGHRLHDGFACGLAYKQVCIIPFRRENLQRFLLLPSTPLEQAESIDMLRILEHGHTVRLVQTPHRTQAVDAPEDIMTVERMMHEDAVCLTY